VHEARLASENVPVRSGQVGVDVRTEIEIGRPRKEVAEYASNPANAPSWYSNIKGVEWNSERPLAVGSRIIFVAEFLGKRVDYIYEVRELEPGVRFVMGTREGHLPMETTYEWEDAPGGGTRMSLRNRGDPAGLSRLTAPLVARAMRRENRKDLGRLKAVLES
jgi:uncharacterized membrane protein